MATIVTGGGISQIVGSHAGTTFARNKGGPYMKRKAHGTNPRSQRQLAHRTVVGQLSKLYTHTLTEPERIAWRTFASTFPVINRLGNVTFLSAQQMFCKLNAPLVANSLAASTSPPVTTAVGTPTTLTVTAVPDPGGSLTVNLATTGSSVDDFAQFWISPPMNPGRAFFSSQLRKIPLLSARDTNVVLTTDYKRLFGLLPQGPGQLICTRGAVVNNVTGIVSAFIQSRDIWT